MRGSGRSGVHGGFVPEKVEVEVGDDRRVPPFGVRERERGDAGGFPWAVGLLPRAGQRLHLFLFFCSDPFSNLCFLFPFLF
jgi:hypothetical protein